MPNSEEKDKKQDKRQVSGLKGIRYQDERQVSGIRTIDD
jgi:hypothetical protein